MTICVIFVIFYEMILQEVRLTWFCKQARAAPDFPRRGVQSPIQEGPSSPTRGSKLPDKGTHPTPLPSGKHRLSVGEFCIDYGIFCLKRREKHAS